MITFAQIGLSFLVFMFGVKIDPERLSSVASDSLKTTVIQVTFVSILGLAISYLLGFNAFESVVFVLATSLSSTLVGLELLEKEIDLKLAHGRIAESIHLSQDIIAIFFLMILGSSVFTVDAVLTSLLHGTGVLLLALIFRAYLFDYIAALAAGSRELLMLVSITMLISFLGLTEFLHISLAIGSFAAGFAVSKYPHNMEILDTTGSLKDFFSAIFFVSLGALLAVPSIEVVLLSGLMLLITSVIKPYTVIASLVHLGQNKRTAYLTGTSIDQVSELSLIIAIQAFLAGMISDMLFQAITITATASMIISSYTTKHGDKIYRIFSPVDTLNDRQEEVSEKLSEHEMDDHIIVLGYDIEGKRIVEKLKEKEVDFVVIENNPEKVTELKERSENYVFGDAMDDKTWHEAQYREAQLIISTVPMEKTSQKILDLETDADKILRAENITEAQNLLDQGAIYVILSKVLSEELLLDHIEGIMENKNYKEELRRKNMLELRRYLQSDEG